MKIRLTLLIVFLLSLVALPVVAAGPNFSETTVKTQLVKSDPCLGPITPAYAQIVTTTSVYQNTNSGGQTHYEDILNRVKTWPSGTQQTLNMTHKFDGNAVNKEACLQAAKGHCNESFVTDVSVVCTDGRILMQTHQECWWKLFKGVETGACTYQ